MASLDDTNDPSGQLIGADQVQGTAVYNPGGERLGSIQDVMIDKVSGRIGYAVLSFGGFLGIGDNYYPLPWEKLSYDVNQGGYIIDLDRGTLEGAPSYKDEGGGSWNDRNWGRQVNDYYGTRPFSDIAP
jgi:sporulation protein YlmC with PRC-barrel domain